MTLVISTDLTYVVDPSVLGDGKLLLGRLDVSDGLCTVALPLKTKKCMGHNEGVLHKSCLFPHAPQKLQ